MKITLKVAAVISNTKNEVLLIKERYEKNQDPKWNLVKGTYDNADETVVDCIKREIKEEVGLIANNIKLKNIFHYGNAENQRVLFVFYVTDFTGEASVQSITEQEKRDENIISVNWFNEEELSKIAEENYMAKYVWLAIKDIKNNSSRNVKISKINI